MSDRSTSDRPTRRGLLGTAAAVGAAAIAGCTNEDQDPSEDPDGFEGPDENDSDENESAENESGQNEQVDQIDYEDPDGTVSFASPEDGDEVESPVQVELEAEGFDVVEAGEGDLEQGAGHHHVLVDQEPVEPANPIPEDEEGYEHLGEGESETELDLEDGEHDLVAQFSDSAHVAYAATDEISIEVTGGDGDGDDGGGNETDGGTNSSEDGNTSGE